MNQLTTEAISILSTGVTITTVIVGLIAWFFLNRISVRANQQIRLLEALLAEQKQQNALLLRVTESLTGDDQAGKSSDDGADQDYIRLIPER